MTVIVDTGAWYALCDRSDRHHASATETYRQLLSESQLVTTSHVLVETWLLLRSRLGRSPALRFWELLRSSVVDVVCPTHDDLDSAWHIASDFKDQDYSFTDSTTFAAMVRLGLTHAFAFDKHFRSFRYGPRKARALIVVPDS